MKNYLASILRFSSFLSITIIAAQAQAPVSYTNGTFTNNSVLGQAGPPTQEVYGVSLGNSSAETTANGYNFGAYTGNSNISYGGSGAYGLGVFLGGGGTSGDTAFNSVLANAELGINNGTLTLKNLTANVTYYVLFLLADTRSGENGRSFSISSGSDSSATQVFAFTGGASSLGGYVLAAFTATGTTQTFQVGSGAYGYQLNGVLVTQAEAPVSFSSGAFTNNSVLGLGGPATQEVYGISLGNSSVETTSNGYNFGAYTNNSNITYGGSGAYSVGGFLSGGGTSGDTAFNSVLASAELGINNGSLTLHNLRVDATYNVLFLLADTRSGLGGRSFSVSSESTTSTNQVYAFTVGTPSLGGYVLATFTATGPNQTFQVSPSTYGYQLNGLLLTQTSDTSLQPVVTDGLPVVGPLTACSAGEAGIESQLGVQLPLYYPYDSGTTGWWDDLVSEQIQARIPVVMIETTGTFDPNPADWRNCPGGLGGCNPYHAVEYIKALNRAGANGVIKFALFYQGAADTVYDNYYGLPGGTPADFSNQDSWNEVWWKRVIQPWFAAIPSSQWYMLNGKVVIEFWGLNGSHYTNQQGNISQLFNYLAAQMQATYGVSPCFIGDPGYDKTLANCTYFEGHDAWYGSPSRPYSMTAYKNGVWGCAVPGACPENFFNPSSSGYHNANSMMPRNGLAGTGQNGDTYKLGLNAMVSSNPTWVSLEGYTDYYECCGLYRSVDPSWDYPNQYLNILASYIDLRTVTQRLLAAGCDANNATTGNLGGAFLRPGQGGKLSVRALTATAGIASSSSTSATNDPPSNAFDNILSNNKWYMPTNAPGWLEYDYGSGNKFVVTSYSITSAGDTPARDPANWQFQGSNDGGTWRTLDTETGQVFANRQQTNQYNINNTTAYEFYRLNISATAGTGTGIHLAELYLMGNGSTGGGWAVTNTTAGEYLQWNSVNFSAGNYKFPLCYSSTASHTATLSIDGAALATVTLPSSGGMNTFTTAYLGTAALTAGTHTLKVTLVDGGPDIQWLFVKKYDPIMGFKSAATNCYLTASLGGNSNMVSVHTVQSTWESFSVDDLLDAGAVDSGDTVNIQAWDGLYLTQSNGGGSSLAATKRSAPGTDETFTIVKIGGSGPIVNGSQVALKTYNGTNYVTVESNGTIDATGTSIGTAQTFTLTVGTQ